MLRFGKCYFYLELAPLYFSDLIGTLIKWSNTLSDSDSELSTIILRESEKAARVLPNNKGASEARVQSLIHLAEKSIENSNFGQAWQYL